MLDVVGVGISLHGVAVEQSLGKDPGQLASGLDDGPPLGVVPRHKVKIARYGVPSEVGMSMEAIACVCEEVGRHVVVVIKTYAFQEGLTIWKHLATQAPEVSWQYNVVPSLATLDDGADSQMSSAD